MSANSGYSFLGTVISAGIVGYVLDIVAKTTPWGFIGFMVIGLIYATYKAQKIMNPPAEKKPDETDSKKDE